VYDRKQKNKLFDAIRYAFDPIVLVWLGTCELSSKKEKYTYLNSYPYQNIEFLLTEYRDFKSEIKSVNPSALVLFIECPYYSLVNANKLRKDITKSKGKNYPSLVVNSVKKNRQVQWAAKIDQALRQQIDYFNEHLRLIKQTVKTPRLSQDLIVSNRYAKDNRVKYRVNNSLLRDGVHPIRILAKLWLYKFIGLVLEVQDWC